MRSQAHAPTQCKLTPPWSKHVFEVYGQKLDKFFQFPTMGEDSPPSTLTSEVRGREKSSKEDKNTTEVRKSVATSAPQNILDIVQHCHLEIGNPNQTRPRPEIQFDSNEKEIIDSEITHLLEMGVIELAVHSPGEYISTLFVRKKKSGKYRMILNLKGLNQHIEKCNPRPIITQ